MPANCLGLTVVEGGAHERLALVFVHRLQNIYVPARDIHSIEVRDEFVIFESGQCRSWPDSSITIGLSSRIRSQLYKLTRQIVGQAMGILIAGTDIASSPVVREPLGIQSEISISLFDLAEANSLAKRLRAAWGRPQLRIVA